MILDANAFIGKWPYWPVSISAPVDVIQELESVNVGCAAICSTRSVFVNWDDGNDETEAAAAENTGRLLPFACLGTNELSHEFHEAAYDFDGYAKRGFRGVRLYPQHHSYHLLFSKFVDVILEDAAARGWPVLLPLRIIMNWGVPSIAPEMIHSIVTRHPKVNWILAGINYLFELQMATSLMLRYENVVLETSCIMGYSAMEKTVQQCGHEQILFGSGAPLQLAAASVAKITHAKISDAAKEALLGKNLDRILGVQAR